MGTKLDPIDLEEIKHEIKSNGFDVSEFTIGNNDNSIWTENTVIQGVVTIKRVSTGKFKSYRTGHGTKFIIDFSKDLNSGYYN